MNFPRLIPRSIIFTWTPTVSRTNPTASTPCCFMSTGTKPAPWPIRPASSVIIAAPAHDTEPGDANYRILMIQRASKGPFGGLTVYPGGAIEASDADPEWTSVFQKAGVDASDLERRSREAEQRFYVGALRETFEEVGILLATPKKRWTEDEISEWRVKVHNDASQFIHMFKDGVGKGYAPDVGRLVHWANWITPAIESKRFDTHFFLAVLPYPAGFAHTKYTAADGKETVSVQWVTPKEVLTQFKEGKIRMFPPQYYTLRDLQVNYPTLAHLSAFAQGSKSRTPFERVPMCPEAKQTPDGNLMLVLPGDELHTSEGRVAVGKDTVEVVKRGGRNRVLTKRDKGGMSDIRVERNMPGEWMSWGEGLDDGRRSGVL
ncbi:hypothetical protein M427DRAFT_155756 [Gonapodya prolifera JEL478]|uniref:Nudix hydrolase domain-containing protein n=1 Tax=Gonapodya prolifera (strain JEL478) TaxID=1344416 RepID=A0A139ADL0_GONPJ|nr:hypothetical protein M427DRAFT_155756 [Gonapodya prolifera JEL478]|eukprot:KXS14881.1 hypothetical protein M427DRAFT_155756 [Gonapodya prolifera JEL478]